MSSKKMNRIQRVFALVSAFVVVVLVGGFLFYHFGPPSERNTPLSTTPPCLANKNDFCTGVALGQANYQTVTAFTKTTGVHPEIVEYYQRFGKPFSIDVATQIARTHARPLIQLDPHGVLLSDIAAGKYDSSIQQYAVALRNFELPVIVGFGHEMNGTWATWSKASPATFIAAWRHIHDIFVHAGTQNVTWAWDISHGARPPQQWWPGAQYVDWVGIDGYLRKGQTFGGQFGKVLRVVAGFAPGKPILIAETAVQSGPDCIKQLNELFARAKAWHIHGLIWFNENRKEDWKLDGRPAVIAAFRNAAKNSTPTPTATP